MKQLLATHSKFLKPSLILALSLFIGLSACKTRVSYSSNAYVEPYLRDTIPYTFARHKEPSSKILLFLPPVLDEVKFEETKLYKFFYDKGYDILCVYKAPAKGAFFYSRKAMDFKDQNVQNVQNLIMKLKQDKTLPKGAKFHVLAMEQGVYMTPSIANTFSADTVFLINGTPFSTYYALQRIAEGKIEWDEKRQNFIAEKFNIDSLSTFQEKVAEVETSGSDTYSLGDYTNMYWLSYHSNYYIDEYSQLPGYACWIYFKDYPLFKQSDFEYQRLLDKTRPESGGKHYLLEGNGRFEDDKDWEQIIETLESYFKE